MSIVDEHGRVFGRFNLVDTAAAVFVLGLIPAAYGTYLLFRPATPRITSVSRSEISKEERRVGSALLRTKLKVKGTGFNPLLRARVGDTPALGFVFENPNSADIMVGPMTPGAHDLVLLDGVQEVARAVGAVTIQEDRKTFIRAVGWLTMLDPAFAKDLKAGFGAPEGSPVFEVVAVGPTKAARSRVSLAGSLADLPLEGRVEREVVLNLRCDPPGDLVNPCDTNGRTLAEVSPFVVSLPGFLRFEAYELLPPTPPHPTRVEVRLSGPAVGSIRAGDRDAFLDERAAAVTTVGTRQADSVIVTLDLGADETREGFRYRSQLLKPGAPFAFAPERYLAQGQVLSVTIRRAATGGSR